MYLDGTEEVPQVFFASLMRSGNTFFRKTLESILGISTGSNLSNNFTLNFALMAQGLKGEGVISNKQVQLVKTHFPYIYPITYPQNGSIAVVLVRQPLDMIMSLFQMAMTLTHTRTVSESVHDVLKEEWAWAIEQYVDLWNKFYSYWLEVASKKEMPVFFFRFEDLLQNRNQTLTEVLEFIYGVDSLHGTYLEKRIKDVLADEASSQLYKPRTGGMNKNLEHYTPE